LSELLDLEESDKISYRKNFDCEEPSLNDYLQKYARKHGQNDVSQTHVLFDYQLKRIVSYYSMSSQSVKKESLAKMNNFPVKEIPSVLIGRLAVDKNAKGQGNGGKTLVEALKKIKALSREIGIQMIIVDALHESAKNFYKAYDFLEFDDQPMRLYKKVSDIQ